MSLLDMARRSDRLVRLYVTPECRASPRRVELSSGTRAASDRDAQSGTYDNGARAPREPWRLPTPEESELLMMLEPPLDYGRSVGILRLPTPAASDCEGVRRGDLDMIEQRLFKPLLDVCSVGEPIGCIGATANPPNLTTTTVDPDTRDYLGLHVDSWGTLPVDRRDSSYNRVSINIGAECRYFLFLPISIVEMAQILRNDIGAEQVRSRDLTLLGRLFMERFPELPVVRCRLAPFEAYIAPTENLVHDGSSQGQRRRDEHYTLLGEICIASR